jgi:hypothetical protein
MILWVAHLSHKSTIAMIHLNQMKEVPLVKEEMKMTNNFGKDFIQKRLKEKN